MTKITLILMVTVCLGTSLAFAVDDARLEQRERYQEEMLRELPERARAIDDMRRRNVVILEKLRREGGGPNVVGAHSLEKFIHNQAMREERLKGIEEEIEERLRRERAQTR